MNKRIQVAIAEPSFLIRNGLINMLHRINDLHIDLVEINVEQLSQQVNRYKPQWVILSLAAVDTQTLQQLKTNINYPGVRFIGLQVALHPQNLINQFDSILSIYDTIEQMRDKLIQLLNMIVEVEDQKKELSQREKEIIVCIVKGLSNKQIADELFLSPHTIATHRRNISNKLQIHSSSGLTIYAIVNKLVDIEEIKL